MLRAPVNDACSAIQKAIVVELLKGSVHGLNDFRIEGKDLARPVARGAELSELSLHKSFVRQGEVEYRIIEFLSRHLEARVTLFLELLFIHHLGLETSMIRAGEPEGLLPAHPSIADHDVLQGHEQRMPGMQRPVRVRGRHDDGEGFWVRSEALLRQGYA